MKYSFWIKTIAFFLIFSAVGAALALLLGATDRKRAADNESTAVGGDATEVRTVIIDAGHGGEDGGASSAAGLVEKEVNLDIALMLRDMLISDGINVVMTREDDRLLYDRNTDYEGRKKKLDLAARLAIADSTPNAIFVSIHMNSFSDPRYSGLQVWYSPNNAESASLAELIREENRSTLQPDNSRQCKSATSAINLLYRAKCPAVLVECGFLSNVEEARLFEAKEYRQRIAYMLFRAIKNHLQNAE